MCWAFPVWPRLVPEPRTALGGGTETQERSGGERGPSSRPSAGPRQPGRQALGQESLPSPEGHLRRNRSRGKNRICLAGSGQLAQRTEREEGGTARPHRCSHCSQEARRPDLPTATAPGRAFRLCPPFPSWGLAGGGREWDRQRGAALPPGASCTPTRNLRLRYLPQRPLLCAPGPPPGLPTFWPGPRAPHLRCWENEQQALSTHLSSLPAGQRQ